MLKKHEIHDKGNILRGTDAYCLGWNAAVEFILLFGDKDENN